MLKNWKTNGCGSMAVVIPTVVLVVAAWLATPAWAQKGKPGGGGGGSTSGGNATVTLDPLTNTLWVTGDSNRNRILVDLRDGVAYIDGIGVTTINGSSSSLKVTFSPENFTLVLDGKAGNDDLWVNVNAVEMAADVQIIGGDGHDYIAVTTPSGPTGLAALDVVGGAGDDLVTVAVNGELLIEGPLTILAGDGADQVEIGAAVFVDGAKVLDGSKRQDKLTLSADLFLEATVTSFESILFW